MSQIMNVLSWTCIVISIVGFVLYLMGKAFKFPKKRLPNLTIILISLSCLLLAIGLVILKNNYEKSPFSHSQKKAALEIANDFSRKLLLMDRALSLLDEGIVVMDRYRAWMLASPEDSLSVLAIRLSEELHQISAKCDTTEITYRPAQQTLNLLYGTPVHMEDLRAFYDLLFASSMRELIAFLHPDVSDGLSAFLIQMQSTAYKPMARILHLDAEALYYSTLDLLSDCPESAYDSFLDFAEKNYTELPRSGKLSRDEAKALQSKAQNKIQGILDSLSLNIGSMTREFNWLSSSLSNQLAEQQNSDELSKLANRVYTKEKQLQQKQIEMEEAKRKLAEKQVKIRDANKLLDSDDQWTMWAKVITLAHYNMFHDARASLDEYVARVKQQDPLAPAYTAVMKILYDELGAQRDMLEPLPSYSGEELGKLGLVVLGFENDKPHSALKVGDIVLSRAGKTVHDVEEWNEIAINSPNRVFTVLRLNENGELLQTQVTGNTADPATKLMKLAPKFEPRSD